MATKYLVFLNKEGTAIGMPVKVCSLEEADAALEYTPPGTCYTSVESKKRLLDLGRFSDDDFNESD